MTHPSPPARPGPSSRSSYATFVPVTARWMDNDVFGHVNNAHYHSYFDTAVCTVLVGAGILGVPGAAHILVVAENGCRYHGETAFPATLEVGVRLARLGGSSVRHEIGVFRQGAALASADGFMVHVCVDAATHRPAPLPDRWRAALAAFGGG